MAGTKRKSPGDEADVNSGAGANPHSGPRPIDGPEPCKSNPGPGLGPGRPHRPAPGVAADGYFRHLYESEPDFKQLAKQDPGLATLSVSSARWLFFHLATQANLPAASMPTDSLTLAIQRLPCS